MGLTKWALLCGGDFYIQDSKRDISDKAHDKINFPNLQGCVQDANAIYDFLIDIGVCRDNITKLTASCGDGGPIEPCRLWPTHKNIELALQQITDSAKPGDLVYIHFSGHGIRRDALPPQNEGDNLMGTALVMTDVLAGGPYLTGYQLGVMVQNMVEKSLRVTLVLDSCFSGGGFRAPNDYKDAGEDAVTPRTILNQVGKLILESDKQADKAADEANPDGKRNPSEVRKDWLSSPTGCVVLTACGLDQVAGEKRLGSDGFKHGVLTYWMLELLRKGKGDKLLSHARVVDLVNNQIKKMRPKVTQSPMIYGDGNYEFFGNHWYTQRPFCRVISNRANTVDLDVGIAQGVAVGALYDVFPHDWVFDSGQEPVVASQARVTHVYYFHCVATLLSEDAVVEEDCLAVLRNWALPSTVPVHFLPKNLDLRSKLENELDKTRNLYLSDDEGSAGAFVVTLDDENTYEILQNGSHLPRLPRIYLEDESGIRKLAYVLSHVGRFQALQRLSDLPRTQHLTATHFAFDIYGGSPALTRDENGRYEVMEEEDLTLSLKYNGVLGSVWLSVFCFTASWGVIKLDPSPESGQIANQGMPNIAVEPFEMSMKIPKKSRASDPEDITDVFVVFASSGNDIAVSWDEICLPSLLADGSIYELLPDINTDDMFRSPIPKKKSTTERRWTVLGESVRTFPKHRREEVMERRMSERVGEQF